MTAKTMAEVLAKHHDWAFSLRTGEVLCVGCDWAEKVGTMDPAAETFRAHQEEMLSDLVADAKAEALEEAAAALERFDRIAATPVNRVTPEQEAEYVEFQRANGDINWLRARAAAVRGEG